MAEGNVVSLHVATDRSMTTERCTNVVTKAIAILHTLGRSRSPMSLASLARKVNIPKTTVHRLIRTLEDQQLVYRTEGGYELLQQHQVVALMPSHDDLDLRDRALHAMLTLYELTHVLVQLMVLDRDKIRCVDQFHAGALRVGVDRGRGSTWLASSTAAGKVLLAQGNPVEFSRAWSTGVAFDRGGTHPGWTSGAALVVGGNQVAAVSITGPPELVTRGNVRAVMAAIAGSAMRRAVLAPAR
jgi:DNA-binding IclR family transcriptional regulator